jgi:hypothetical protein
MEDEKAPLSRRVPGAARVAPGASARPVLPAAVIERMRAAIDAERGEARDRSAESTSARQSNGAGNQTTPAEPITEPIPRVGLSSDAAGDAGASASARSETAAPGSRTSKRKSRPKREGRPTPPRTEPADPTTHQQAATPREVTVPTQARAPESAPELAQRNGTATTDPSVEQPAALAQPMAAPASAVIPGAAPLSDTAPLADIAPLADLAPRPEAPPQVESATPSRLGLRPEHAADPKPELHRSHAAPGRSRASLDGSGRPGLGERAQPAPRVPDKERRPSSAPAPVRPGARSKRIGQRSAGLRGLASGRIVASVVVLVAAASVVIALSMRGTSRESSNRSVTRMTALQKEVLATRQLAANWVAQEASTSARVACDPAMCAAIGNAGFSRSELDVLGDHSPAPLTSDFVVETAYVRTLLGTSFAANNAPDVIAAFGKGAASIQIRLIAKDGAAAYQRALTSDFTASKDLAGTLLSQQGNGQITALAAARTQMAAGEVDIRAVYALIYLAAVNPIEVIDFGNVARDASEGLQLRYVDLAANDTAAHLDANAYRAWMLKSLKTAPYRYLWANFVTLQNGIKVLRVDFGAPTPLGLKQ